MCDWTPVRNWLLATLAAVFSAAATVLVAAVLNGSWWYAYLSTVAMLIAAGFAYLAVGGCALAKSALTTFCTCAGPNCQGPCNNLANVILGAIAVLGIQGAACLLAIAPAWVPGAGQTPMYVIIGALLIEAALIISAFAFFAQLTSCQKPFVPPPDGPPIS